MKEEKDKKNITESEVWNIYSNPLVSAFVFALASMIASGEFMRLVTEGDWIRACVFVFVTWLGFFLFFSIVSASAAAFLVNWKLFNKLKKWKTAIAVLFSILVFVIVYYIMWSVLPNS